MKDEYFIHLIPIDEKSKEILKEKEYKNTKSISQMWLDSL